MTSSGVPALADAVTGVGRPRAHCWEDVLGDDERLAAAAYAGRRHVRSRRALLMVDLYNRAFGHAPAPLREAVQTEPSSCGLAAWAALPWLEALLQTARRAGAPVVHTVSDERSPSSRDATFRPGTQTGTGHPSDHSPSWGNTIIDQLSPIPGEMLIEKQRASAFFGTTLDTHLRMIGVEAVIVAGETTSGCVRATVVDAYSLGFDVVVAEEGTFDRSPLSHRVALFDMHCKYATVLHADQAITLLTSDEPAVLRVP